MAGFALIGLVGVIPVSYSQAVGSSMCPHLGPLPICHVVTLAYLTMFISVLNIKFWRPPVFLMAWMPVFGLALAGTSLELVGYDVCPKTAGGWPKCYFSLLLACAVIGPVIVHWKLPASRPIT